MSLKKDEISARLKEIKDLTFELRIKVNVITKEEFTKITNKIDRSVERLMDDIKE